MTTAELLATATSHLYGNYRQPPLVLTHGSGCEVWDADGKCYLDLSAGIAVNTLGHAHPRLLSAVAGQAARLIHVSNYFYNDRNVQLAGRLCRLTGYDRALFCNSGTEAIEALLKLARRHFTASGEPQRFHVIAFDGAFHGRTMGALAATSQAAYRTGFGPLGAVTHVAYGDIDAVRAALGPEVAAVLVEPVLGEGGVIPAPAGFLADLRQLCDQSGTLLLADEVQTGVGRTGRWLAFEHSGVRSDAVAMAKGLGGGIPIGAVLCTEALAEALPPGSHGSTFGGNPLASAAALAVLDVIETEGLLPRVQQLGDVLAEQLHELIRRHPETACDARGLGLLQALVLSPKADPAKVLVHARELGLLLTVAGGRALRFSPPLTVHESDLRRGVEILDRALGVYEACLTC